MNNVVSIYHLNGKTNEFDIEVIFNAYYKRMYNYIFYRISCHHTAEDLTSRVFEKVYTKQKYFNEAKGNFEVWMFTIAKNEINDFLRKKKRKSFVSLEKLKLFPSSSLEPEDSILKDEEESELAKSLNKLGDKDREILALKYALELKNTEIAKILNMSSSNVGVSIHRAVNKLKKVLQQEGYYEK